MKNSAYLINKGRGQLIDSDGLYQVLVTKKITVAALDVFESGGRHELDDSFPLKSVQLGGCFPLEVLAFRGRSVSLAPPAPNDGVAKNNIIYKKY
ncbi:hypothetical protein E4665_06660 [Sporolactobacillus shoreae]|uniref:D-isomer specific 2-hydroxyacid dehydrogenase NAD-binding domain-containing protein n=1 Tax=Sporolactobacillus shoreae TaxID=1465501 RepID=A0A4Z0GRD3_9BACL|nr:NAD(P)-dependent oxidoreductase [Sporolactobacillus shoreae]TGA98996.1 hypothetical protein E4665_06660 [Sporolactobacillus shoreae]